MQGAGQENLLRRFWQRRYYDFNVYSPAKVLEKLHYMHSNPVWEKLFRHPGDWPGAVGASTIAAKASGDGSVDTAVDRSTQRRTNTVQ